MEQAKGKGGFMLNCSIGRTARVMGGLLNINLSITNLTNNRTICTGGYESNYDVRQPSTDGSSASLYNFAKNPRKFYAFGTSGMLNITYSFYSHNKRRLYIKQRVSKVTAVRHEVAEAHSPGQHPG